MSSAQESEVDDCPPVESFARRHVACLIQDGIELHFFLSKTTGHTVKKT